MLTDRMFGRAFATVDGRAFDLGVGGARQPAVVHLFARRPVEFREALASGRQLTLALAVLPEGAKEGAGAETTWTFALNGLAEAMG